MKRSWLSFLPFLALPAAAQHAAPRQVERLTPFVTLEASADVITMGYDALGTLEDLRRTAQAGATLTLRDWALPGIGTVDLRLRPFQVMEAGGSAVVHLEDGSTERLAPSVQLLEGHVPGRASQVFLAFARDQVNGYVELEGQVYVLTSGGDTASGQAWIHRLGASGAGAPTGELGEWCHTVGDASVGADPGASELSRLVSEPERRHAQVFMELDNRYRGRFSSDQAAIDYCVTLVGASSLIYRRDLSIVLEIPDGFINLWNSTPPWGVLNDFGDIGAFSNWWRSAANPNRDVRRAAVHALTNPVFGGVAAALNSLCSHGNGYEISSVNGSFPMPVQHTSPGNWDLIVVSHEFGHTFGAQHTFEIGIACGNGTGPDIGTIMSYCHLDFGIGAIGLRFHRRIQEDILFTLATHPCIDIDILQRGDHDADGDLDQDDLDAFDAYQAQGFFSLGSEEIFDMDADSVVDGWDREVLLARIAGLPAATADLRNGTGANPECYFSSDLPVLGRTWGAFILATGGTRPTLLLGTAEPLAGQATPYGELLIRTQAAGGQNLLQLSRVTQFFQANYQIDIPRAIGLAGLALHTQGLAFNASGPTLCNAIDLVLSFY